MAEPITRGYIEFDTGDMLVAATVTRGGTVEASKFADGYYLNRLFVHKDYRRLGIATALMNRMCAMLDKLNASCICEVNPYGDMSEQQLRIFYRQFKFVDAPDGSMIRSKHHDI